LFGVNRLVLLIAVVFAGCGLFNFKYKVADLNSQAQELEREITRIQCDVKILSAELRYLTAPKRLQRLANRHMILDKTEVNRLFSLSEFKTRLNGRAHTVRVDPLQNLLVKVSAPKPKKLSATDARGQ
jgi:cell division protein FtsL